MPGKKSSVFTRRSKVSRPKFSKKPEISKKTKPRPSGDMITKGINDASALGLHIQQLLTGTFAPAPPVLREYLKRADHEIRDLIKLLVTKHGGTPDDDHIAITATASCLLEDLAGSDPETAVELATILSGVRK